MREMKDSGVEWIGKIPKDWNVCKLKRIAERLTDGTHGTYERTSEGYLLLSAKNVFEDGLHIGENESLISEEDYKSIISNGFPRENDVLLCCVGTIGRCTVYKEKEPIAFQRSVIFIRCNNRMLPSFLNYNLQSPSTLIQEKLSVNKSAQEGIYQVAVKELQIVLPGIKQQKQIIDYLDAKCSKINEVIEKQQAIVEKLKEYKLSVIIETVTKGLNPNVEMKDSGVEWIGQMPTSWDCTTVGMIATVVRGASPRPAGDPLYFNGTDVPWITVAEVTKGDGKYIDGTETFLTFEGAKQSRIVEEGTLLLSNSGATLGVPKITRIRGCINDGSVAFYNLSINQEFLLYLFKGRTFELRKQMQGYGQPNLNTTIVKGIEVPLPTELEQKAIVEFLDQKCTAIEKTIEDREKAIDKLQEYKKSLIYEVVTGKKEV